MSAFTRAAELAVIFGFFSFVSFGFFAIGTSTSTLLLGGTSSLTTYAMPLHPTIVITCFAGMPLLFAGRFVLCGGTHKTVVASLSFASVILLAIGLGFLGDKGLRHFDLFADHSDDIQDAGFQKGNTLNGLLVAVAVIDGVAFFVAAHLVLLCTRCAACTCLSSITIGGTLGDANGAVPADAAPDPLAFSTQQDRRRVLKSRPR